MEKLFFFVNDPKKLRDQIKKAIHEEKADSMFSSVLIIMSIKKEQSIKKLSG